jgi:two-component system chemotaxis response regulator CheY
LCQSQAGKTNKMMALDVLIVDHSVPIRKILARVLSQTELPIEHVHEAGDASEALRMIGGTKVGLILSGLDKPGIDGLQLVLPILTSHDLRQVPVIVMAGQGNQARILEAIRLGARGCISKPFSADQIEVEVSACLQARVIRD